jgi:hypothetical protein
VDDIACLSYLQKHYAYGVDDGRPHLFPIPARLLEWVTSAKHCWIIFAERRSGIGCIAIWPPARLYQAPRLGGVAS